MDNPTGFALTPGQAHDLEGVDVLLPLLAAGIIIADKAYDADARELDPLAAAGKTAVIPPKSNRNIQHEYDTHIYKARNLFKNFFAKLKQYRAIATRYDKLDHNLLGSIYAAGTIILLN